ncbi:MAG: hypothetical protein HY519_03765 [Candidatus Aenigmarchaeota archaeon]|nr:hypothetical protein [Candidatus Aenigmarchaeota archaeon]
MPACMVCGKDASSLRTINDIAISICGNHQDAIRDSSDNSRPRLRGASGPKPMPSYFFS